MYSILLFHIYSFDLVSAIRLERNIFLFYVSKLLSSNSQKKQMCSHFLKQISSEPQINEF